MLARIFATIAGLVLCLPLTSGCKSNRFFAGPAPDPQEEMLAESATSAATAAASDIAGANVVSPAGQTENTLTDAGSSTKLPVDGGQFDLPPTLAGGRAVDPTNTNVTPASASVESDQQFDNSPTGISAVPTQLASAARKTLDVFRMGSERPPYNLAEEIASFEKFPFAFNLPTVGGEQNDSRQFQGQLMVVDIWATWCGPCKKAIPEFVELQSEFESHGVQVIGITCDSDDPAAAAETTRKAYNIGQKLGVNYPLLVDDGTTKGQIPGFRSYPTTLFLTADGQVQYMVVGVQPKERMAQIIRAILQI